MHRNLTFVYHDRSRRGSHVAKLCPTDTCKMILSSNSHPWSRTQIKASVNHWRATWPWASWNNTLWDLKCLRIHYIIIGVIKYSGDYQGSSFHIASNACGQFLPDSKLCCGRVLLHTLLVLVQLMENLHSGFSPQAQVQLVRPGHTQACL